MYAPTPDCGSRQRASERRQYADRSLMAAQLQSGILNHSHYAVRASQGDLGAYGVPLPNGAGLKVRRGVLERHAASRSFLDIVRIYMMCFRQP